MDDVRRSLPAVDRVLAQPILQDSAAALGREFVKSRVRAALEHLRRGADVASGADAIAAAVSADLPDAPTSMRRVINATGVIIHTNLGRAPLSAAATAALTVAAGATDVELDLATGKRAPRGAAAIGALSEAAGGASAHVVNNGAAAIALACYVMAPGGNIVLSRGEMVEIGDGFRIPELIAATGVEIREVGTTNRTHLRDYLAAIDERTGFVLKIHPSNFHVDGFTSSVPVRVLAREAGVPVVADIGSGLLTPNPHLPLEPDARTALNDGAALVIASGDKLLGGPQAGLLLGEDDLIHRLRRHPLARALRVDKFTLAALEATLLGPPTPVARALDAHPPTAFSRAEQIAEAIGEPATSRTTHGAVGGGGAPGVELRSAAVVLPAELAVPLRTGRRPIVGRVSGGELLLDLLAVDPLDDAVIIEAVREVLG